MATRSTAQQRVLDVAEYIFTYTLENGVAPSLREIAEEFGVAVGTISTAMNRGIEQGLLERRGDAKYRAVYATETPETIERKIQHLRIKRYRMRTLVTGCALPGVAL